MINTCFYLPISEFVERYPTPELKAPDQVWTYHLRQWREGGIFISGTHYKTIMGQKRLVFVYHERAVIVYIHKQRSIIPFCGLVCQHNLEAIEAFIHPSPL